MSEEGTDATTVAKGRWARAGAAAGWGFASLTAAGIGLLCVGGGLFASVTGQWNFALEGLIVGIVLIFLAVGVGGMGWNLLLTRVEMRREGMTLIVPLRWFRRSADPPACLIGFQRRGISIPYDDVQVVRVRRGPRRVRSVRIEFRAPWEEWAVDLPAEHLDLPTLLQQLEAAIPGKVEASGETPRG